MASAGDPEKNADKIDNKREKKTAVKLESFFIGSVTIYNSL